MGNRIIATGLFFLVIFLAYLVEPETFRQLVMLLRGGDAVQIAAYIRSFGGWAVLVSISLSIVMTFGLIVPFVLIAAVNGLVFGLGWGTVVSWAGEVIGALIAFAFYRYYFRPSVIRHYAHTEHWRHVEKISGEHGFKMLLLARILPLVPSGLLTAAASVSTISFSDFAWATILGKLPSVFAKVLIGHDLIYFANYKMRFILGVLCIGLLYAAAWGIKRRKG